MSQTEAMTTTIGDHEYAVYMLPPMKSHNLLVDVMKMAGPALGPLFDGILGAAAKGEAVNPLDSDAELGADFFTKSATAIFEHLNKATLEEVIKAFRDVTTVDGKKLAPMFDLHFQGELGSMYRWLVFAAKVQWSKSFGALIEGVASRGATLAATGKGSQSPNT